MIDQVKGLLFIVSLYFKSSAEATGAVKAAWYCPPCYTSRVTSWMEDITDKNRQLLKHCGLQSEANNVIFLCSRSLTILLRAAGQVLSSIEQLSFWRYA